MVVYKSVISLLIRDAQNRVLVGVRDPETNLTHPDVVSTPTQRIPSSLAIELLRYSVFSETQKPPFAFPEKIISVGLADSARRYLCDNSHEDTSFPLFYVVNSLIHQKLGILKPIAYDARVGSFIDGLLIYEQSDNKSRQEYLRMIGIDVDVKDSLAFPDLTGSYSSLAWLHENQFDEMLATRSVLPVANVFGRNSIGYCVQGLCLLSAYVILDNHVMKQKLKK